MNLFNRNATLKPLKAHKAGKRSELSDYSKKTLATLGTGGNMKQAVQLPPGENVNEWLAVNTVDFFNELSMLYGTVSEYCSAESCPVMTAGDKYQYLWCDGVKIRRPIVVSAPQYVDLLMTWVESQLNDEEVFPIKFDAQFPKRFQSICCTIYKRFFRIYSHVYHHHLARIRELQADQHLNTCFKHFIFFVLEFNLISADEQLPLKDLIDSMLSKEKQQQQQHSAAAAAVAASQQAQQDDQLTSTGQQDVIALQRSR